jgi:hypothetical protein
VQAAATGGLGSPNKNFVSVRSQDGADASGSRANKNGRRVARPQSWPGAARHGADVAGDIRAAGLQAPPRIGFPAPAASLSAAQFSAFCLLILCLPRYYMGRAITI